MITLDTWQHLVRTIVRLGLAEAHELVRPIGGEAAIPYDPTIDHNHGYELAAFTYNDLNQALYAHERMMSEFGSHHSSHRWVNRTSRNLGCAYAAIAALRRYMSPEELHGLTPEILVGSRHDLLAFLDSEERRSLQRWVTRSHLGIAWPRDATAALRHHVSMDELLGLAPEVLLGSRQTVLDYLDRDDVPYDGMVAQVRKVLGLAQLAITSR